MNWTYEDFTKAIFELTRIDLSSYKERQMKRRIKSLISRSDHKGYNEYYNALLNNKDMLEYFRNYLTINVSEFYRNPGQWEVLKEEIIPKLLENKNKLKIWSAACSTGEEPYSMAMLLRDFLPFRDIKILATDINKEVLKKAEEGVYLKKSLRELPKSYRRNFFTMKDGLYHLDTKVKQCVEFRQHDLLADAFPKNCDLIICRNVMIYFTEDAKNILYKKFRESLGNDGVLFVGSTEQIIFSQKYDLNSIRTFFYMRGG